MKVNFGGFEVFTVKINFAYEGKNIWVNIGNVSDLIAGGKNMGVSGGFMMAEAQRRYPELTEGKVAKLPYITESGEPSEEYQWYYRIDLDLIVFGLSSAKIIMIDTEIHQPLEEGLKEEMDSQ